MASLDHHSLESAREALRIKIFDQGIHYRILFVGRTHAAGTDDVASCLSRSLRNLGHHVFELDLKKHRDLTESPVGVAGGVATVVLKPVEFDRFCHRVNPQIAIFCGSGLIFHPDHAQALKQRGIILVGLTLDDPDGIAASHAHANLFDFHTTTARRTLACYHGAGVLNTLYFPLGMDRGLLTQGDAPERYRKITRATFQRIASGHLYEHRWMSLLEVVFNCSPDTTPWLDDPRIQKIRQVLAQSLPRCKQVLVSGFYGAGNLGDELILRAIDSALRNSDAAIQITVAAENPVAVERDHGLAAFPRRKLNEALSHVRTAQVMVIGGGGLWHDYTFAKGGGLVAIFQEPQLSMASFASLPLMGRFFGTTCHVLGMGIGPITEPDAFRMLRFVADLADTIQVRDEASLDLLKLAGVAAGKAFVAPDLVYSLPLPVIPVAPAVMPSVADLKAEGYTVVGLNLRPWQHCDERDLFARLAQALKMATRSAKLAIITIPMQDTDDLVLSKFVVAWGVDVQHIELKSPLSLEDLLGAISLCDLVLSMRLHACLLAHRLRKPVVGLVYDPKVANHFAQLGRSALAVPLDGTAATLADALTAALQEQGRLPNETQDKLRVLEEKAQDALNAAARRIAALPGADKVFEVPNLVESIRGELLELRAFRKLHTDRRATTALSDVVVHSTGFAAAPMPLAITGRAERIGAFLTQ